MTKHIFILAGTYRSFKDFCWERKLNTTNASYIDSTEKLEGIDGRGKDILVLDEFWVQDKADSILSMAKARGFNIKHVADYGENEITIQIWEEAGPFTKEMADKIEQIVMPADITLVSEDTFKWLIKLGYKYKHELYDDIFNGTEYHMVEIAESDGINVNENSQLDTYKNEINRLLLLVLLQQA